MHWTDDGPAEPVALDNLIAFVRHTDSQVAWGNQTRTDHQAVSIFQLDLATGAYTYTSRLGRPAIDRCHSVDGTI